MSTSHELLPLTPILVDKLTTVSETILDVSNVLSSKPSFSSTFAVESRGLRPVDRQKLWNSKLIALGKDCLKATAKLAYMQRKHLCVLKGRYGMFERGIPAPDDLEGQLYREKVAQWHIAIALSRDYDCMLSHKRSKILSAQATENEREMVLKRNEVMNLVAEGKILHERMLKRLAKARSGNDEEPEDDD